MFESRWHYADNLYCLTIKLNVLADDVWIAAETARPKSICEDDDVISARLELFGFECTAVRGSDAQHWKEISGGCEAEQTFRGVTFFGEVTAGEVGGRHFVKDCVLIVLVEEVSG